MYFICCTKNTYVELSFSILALKDYQVIAIKMSLFAIMIPNIWVIRGVNVLIKEMNALKIKSVEFK